MLCVQREKKAMKLLILMSLLQSHGKQKGGKDGSEAGPGTGAEMVEIKTQREMYTNKYRPYVSMNNSGLPLH